MCPLSGESCPHKQTVSLPVLKKGGEKGHVSICESCPFNPNNIKEMIIPCDPIKLLEVAIQQQLVDANSIRCQGCGLTMRELQATGKLGCEHCYQYFYDMLVDLLLRAHGASSHKGKSPKIGLKKDAMEKISTSTTLDFTDVLELLERKLKAAVDSENYENAAVIRDIIKQVKLVKEKETVK